MVSKDSRQEMIVFQGTIVDSSGGRMMNVEKDCLLGVKDGKIIFRENIDCLKDVLCDYDVNKEDIRLLSPREFLMPGFIDTHLHAPQYRFLGSHLDLTLLDWLANYTYPTEAKFCDLDYASEVYNRVVKQTLRTGTTCAVYFATFHLDASLLLCDIAEKHRQRAFIGKVSMDKKPDFKSFQSNMFEEESEAVRNAEQFIKQVLNKQNPLLCPVVTPRFAPSCTSQLMQSLGDIAANYKVPIQSHLSETPEELVQVKKLFPQFSNYTEVYDHFNLLTDKTIMAHGVHLNDQEIQLLKDRKTGIAHCPNSNISIRSGLCDVRKLKDQGLNVGLGTDVSAGYSLSMLDAMRYAVLTSKVLSMRKPNYKHFNHEYAFYLATLGGYKLLKIDDALGTLEVNKEFDALLVHTDAPDNQLCFSDDETEEMIEKFISQGDDRNISEVYVAGQQVK